MAWQSLLGQLGHTLQAKRTEVGPGTGMLWTVYWLVMSLVILGGEAVLYELGGWGEIGISLLLAALLATVMRWPVQVLAFVAGLLVAGAVWRKGRR